MALQIRPIQQDDIPELSQLLIRGFHLPLDAEIFSAETLLWKYFDPCGEEFSPRGFVAHRDGRIVGYVGLSPSAFISAAFPQPIPTTTAFDWLAAESGAHIGSTLMQQQFRYTRLQFLIGGSDAARSAYAKLGYKVYCAIPIFCRILRPTHRFRQPRQSPIWKAVLQASRDYGLGAVHPTRSPVVPIDLQRVTAFGPEVGLITATCQMDAIHTKRTPELLNHFLRYPQQTISGWHLLEGGRLRGFAMLSVVQSGPIRIGKITDCLLDCLEPELWHSALYSLTQQLWEQAADVVLCYGTTPWMVPALKHNGFRHQRQSQFAVHDPENLIPNNAAFYLTYIEADGAYL